MSRKHLEKLSRQQLIEVLAAVERNLECSVCLECIRYMAITCSNGHGVCTDCAKNLQTCPECRAALSSVKPTMLNSVISVIPRPCKHSSNGCDTTILPSSDEHSETYCVHRDISCKVNGCIWEGPVYILHEHLTCSHAKILLTANNPTIKWPVLKEEEWYHMPVYAFYSIMWARVKLGADSLEIFIDGFPENVIPRLVAVISLERGNIKFTETISVNVYKNTNTSFGSLKNILIHPRGVADFFLNGGCLIHSLKITEVM